MLRHEMSSSLNFGVWLIFLCSLRCSGSVTESTRRLGGSLFIGNTSPNVKEEVILQSPGYPENYPLGINLNWICATAPGHRVHVVFNDFDLESGHNCNWDSLRFYDGRDASSPILGTYCGHGGRDLGPVVTRSNILMIRFQSDFSLTMRGFNLSLSAVCGGEFQAQTHENSLVSHTQFGEDIYGANETCSWIISSRTDRNVQVTFSDFEVEKDLVMTDTNGIQVSNCESVNCVQNNEPQDYVEIFDGPDDSNTRIGKYFGNRVPPPITSRGDKLLIRFRSGQQSNSRGFRAIYKEL